MDKIRFPEKLENLLKGTELFAPIRDYANRVGEILDDKQMPFFPSYTDHSAEHVTQVLQAEVDLIPAKVWQLCETDNPQQRLLRPEDAAVLIGGTLLHDIAMHLHPDGFLELVGETKSRSGFATPTETFENRADSSIASLAGSQNVSGGVAKVVVTCAP